jgi:hypothetical protein
MPMHDWIHKYPQVQTLLQQPDEVLDYAVDGETSAAPPWRPHLRRRDLYGYPPVRRKIWALLKRRAPCCRCGAPCTRVGVRFPEGLEHVDTLADLARLRYDALCNRCPALSPP